MAIAEDPVVGNWYTNRNGELLRLRLAVYRHEYLSALLLEYLDGHREIISLGDWYALELHRDMISITQRHVST
ncbi:MAG: hypothetical protein ACLFQT_03540 [Thiohalophilus sp.]